jgi:geranylgeranyl diphosphate synthase, type II
MGSPERAVGTAPLDRVDPGSAAARDKLGARRLQLLPEAEMCRLLTAFPAMLPLDGRLETHLRGVLIEVLAHPGNLVRAQLAYSMAGLVGMPSTRALALAIATEYFHTASLIFDDLPSMDDARARRGHPCPHVTHGEAAATLGALALITRGYALLWEAIETPSRERRAEASSLVSECLGVNGILDGQARDVHFPASTAEPGVMLALAAAKSVPLIRLALVLPAVVAGAGAPVVARLEQLATSWGLAYQILDDFKDCLLSDLEAGKSTGRDWRLGRPNLPTRAGQRTAHRQVARLLAESRGLAESLEARFVEGWTPLRKLQAHLEEEHRGVGVRLHW